MFRPALYVFYRIFFYLTPLIRLSYRGLTSLSPHLTPTLSARRGSADYIFEIPSYFLNGNLSSSLKSR